MATLQLHKHTLWPSFKGTHCLKDLCFHMVTEVEHCKYHVEANLLLCCFQSIWEIMQQWYSITYFLGAPALEVIAHFLLAWQKSWHQCWCSPYLFSLLWDQWLIAALQPACNHRSCWFRHGIHCVASLVHLFAWDCQPFALHIMMLKLRPKAKCSAAIAWTFRCASTKYPSKGPVHWAKSCACTW